MDFLEYVGIPFPAGIVYPLAWLVALVLVVMMAGKGRGKAEKFLLTVCIVMFILQFVMPFLYGLVYWLTGTILYSNYFNPILNAIGIVLLVVAFWKKHKTKDM